ncbi:ROK family transcriptional regulator [Herbiconiux flava]|uniref:Putative NBD/HSP70 family sugar kinase n=1 Tax=Herbiconiux flava TaxID=881268 RepID=A0A852SRB5_9MICO|nr:ROK family transcriptional regulator [Herbiconiux flava]NYD71264.1 putative NBD/HSP70 family sugar kinase [Herbiconiux flava]GLK18772.1 NagC family transcriptional regulator [Herbiconiux flava]
MTASGAGGSGRVGLLDFVRRAGQTTRRSIAEHTGLSRSVVAQTVSELIERGLLVERSPAAATTRGRPTAVLELARQPGVVLAFDIGHRHVTVAVADLHGRVLAEPRVDLVVDDGAAPTIRALRRLTTHALARAGAAVGDVAALGVSFPYPVLRPSGAVRAPAALPGWQGVTAETVRPAGFSGPIVADNDANFGAWGERMRGGTALDDMLYVKLGDGIGAGLVVGGRLLAGARGTGGEMGHIQVEPGGLLCRCGGHGCLETVVAASLPDEHLAGLRVGRAIAQLCTFVDTSIVVLGGRFGAAGGPLVEGVREAVARFSPPGESRVEVRVAALGARAELVGIVDRTVSAAWASGTAQTGSMAHSSWDRTNSPAVLEHPFRDERVS